METKKSLKFVVPVKTIHVNDKQIKIPKLGLKHYRMLKDLRSCDETVKLLIDSIHPGLNAAEAEMVMLHLCAFNGKCQSEKDDLSIDDVYICTETKFELNGVVYEFLEPDLTIDPIVDDALFLKEHYTEDVNFHEFPAFIKKWADGLRKTIALDTPDGTIYGGINILEKLQ